uniref:Mce/MlaD domain-containing protein n=1 Tax=Dichotomaria marginata TaxID=268567 RepID=A0A1G4NS68_9FLOR|nr:Hypothetical protein ycf22 [Dichotomaria marginata]SCW21507.1 Hypothetical protein ycf22 [Dichotomaria marginata]
MKIKSSKFTTELITIIFLFFIIIFTCCSWLILNTKLAAQTYSIFIELDHSSGIQKGTPLRYRGLNIGTVKEIVNGINSVLALVTINSTKNLIPSNSLIETNQTGLLNEAVIDVIPLETIYIKPNNSFNPLSVECSSKHIICHLSYIQGDRGLNYDDLVRAATRISQRFDDPRFFNLFYIFLQNSVELTDNIIDFFVDVTDVLLFYVSKIKQVQ